MDPMSSRVVVLGSTGSIGTQALDVVRANPDRFDVVALAAGGADPATLASQALEFGVELVAVANATAAQDVQLALYAEAQRRGWSAGEYRLPRLVAGPDAAVEAARVPADTVLNGMTGAVGLMPTLAALETGATLALANKESLIIGGELVLDAAKPGQLVPVDSEHSALAQALRGEDPEDVRRLVLTASGGPFRGRSRDELLDVTPEQASAHPTWDMGPVITINSATLVNKGLEVIEAHLLFGIEYDRIDVVVHPTSVVHSMVEFVDGSTMAQASPPDMRLPIALGLSWPRRVPGAVPACDWTSPTAWEFFPLDDEAFPAIRVARRAGAFGRTAPAVFNAANEVCVDAFMAGDLDFLGIVDTVAEIVDDHLADPEAATGDLSVERVLEADARARERARQVVAVRAGAARR
ncbi:1-deoxy-D-xylulose-5-phosphate reductoisomerase [Aeromicrobium tamlense]|uniref:1-deoxy-D-xylulose 5-phosphate reductoisomerase n=2 Tax=Aeromicrobium tamlense TaxID=375541 RepID=A0A8I0KHK8_9ACTN|nr:1-deoxy-D-xylulose-5-phosphate reductoisomerase [Aeromicrobium tamlense]